MQLGQARVTVLVENTSGRAGLEAEHGFSAWIETGESKVLFDTGASGLLCRNAEALGIDLAQADAVVLSHGHYDHVGGLDDVMKLARNATIYVHPAAGIDCSGRRVMLSRASEIVVPGIRTTGQIKRVTDFETSREAPIPFPDDQAIYFEVAEGVVVIVGCAHAGAINTLRQVARLTKRDKIHTVFGGMHLLHASDKRVERTAAAFRELGLERIGPCHCTGGAVIEALAEEFPDAFFRCSTGTVMTFGGNGG